MDPVSAANGSKLTATAILNRLHHRSPNPQSLSPAGAFGVDSRQSGSIGGVQGVKNNRGSFTAVQDDSAYEERACVPK